MLPKIWIVDTYSLLIFIGVVLCLLVLSTFLKKYKSEKAYIADIQILGCIAILVGIGSATLFQFIYDYIKQKSMPELAMTFYGGLIGGALAFILLYKLWIMKKYPNESFLNILIIAPACICLAHGFGRIGCYCAGCCYGIETDSWLGVTFPGHDHKVLPTQLFEAIYLLILGGVLFYLAYSKHFKYTMPIYLISYGIFRFVLEFFRGDDRGAFLLSLSPSQWISIIMIITSVVVFILLLKNTKKKENES